MADFTGKQCIACNEHFKVGDDIVVCPDCGTPYHRACYNEHGECINYTLHESGESWREAEQEKKAEFSTEEAIKCPRCGTENPPMTLFCESCGLPLGMKTSGAQQSFNQQNFGQNPHVGMGGFGNPYGQGNPMGMGPMGMPFMQTQKITPDMDIDGNTVGEYAEYIGSNRPYFLAQFLRFAKTKAKSSFSFVGFMFPEYYFFYRKMYKEGIIASLLTILLTLPNMIFSFHVDNIEKMMGGMDASMFSAITNNVNLSSGAFNAIYNIFWIGSLALQIVCGIFANYWYYKKAKKTIEKAKSLSGIENPNEAIARKGGTSWGLCIMSICVNAALMMLALVAVKYRADILAFLK